VSIPEPRLSRDEALEIACEALSALTCPYYRFEAPCESGCTQEPGCVVDRPSEGWERVLRDAAEELVRSDVVTQQRAMTGRDRA
jgi:hypothetical protein